MSRDAAIELAVWDGDYTFRLGWGELAQLQEKCNAGPYVILQRMSNGGWRLEDIEGILRIGLIGAGRKPEEATKLINQHVKTRPAAEYAIHATLILQAAVLGAPDEPLGEQKAPSLTDQ